MIVFITSIRHPLNTNSYELVWGLLEDTLHSVCNQTDTNFKVIVVANKILNKFKNIPIIKYVEYVKVDFPPPLEENITHTGMGAIRLDRSTKYIVGLLAAKKYDPEYIMFFDADDFISNRISSYVNSHPGQNGWYIDRGYLSNLKVYTKSNNFHMRCGTCNIFSMGLITDEIDMKDINIRSNQEDIKRSTDDHYLMCILGSHKFAAEYFDKKGQGIKPFPYRAAIWNQDTGENHSPSQWRESSNDWPRITDKIIEEFNINNLKNDKP